MKLLIECILINLLLTIFVYIGTKDDKTKLKGFYYYPKVHIESFFRGIIVTFLGAVLVGYIFIK